MIDCVHINFTANVEITRLFDDESVTEDQALTRTADSLAIDVTAACADCGKAVRFEGPVGIGVGPGAPPMVSPDGVELRAAGHMGTRDGRTMIAKLRGPK